MTNYGKITHYNAIKGTGMISPEDGGDALAFDRTGLQQQAQEPRSDQIYTYGTQASANGEMLAVNLQMEPSRSADPQHSDQNGDDGGFDQTGQSQARANQDAARRPGVDAQIPGVERQHGESRRDLPNEGTSEFQPLRADAGDMLHNQQGQSHGRTSQAGSDHAGVSRAGVQNPESGGIRTNQMNAAGSAFQPLAQGQGQAQGDDPDSHDTQHGNEPGQNQQGLNTQNPEQQNQAQQSQTQQGQTSQGRDGRDHKDTIQYNRDGDPVISQEPRGNAPNPDNRR